MNACAPAAGPLYQSLFDVRIRVAVAGRNDAYFDLTNLGCDTADEAIRYATSLASECFGLSPDRLHVHVLSAKPVIDC